MKRIDEYDGRERGSDDGMAKVAGGESMEIDYKFIVKELELKIRELEVNKREMELELRRKERVIIKFRRRSYKLLTMLSTKGVNINVDEVDGPEV